MFEKTAFKFSSEVFYAEKELKSFRHSISNDI